MHRLDEGKRGDSAPRRLSGRGLAYWSDGKQERIVYVTPGYQMIALDAKTGQRIPFWQERHRRFETGERPGSRSRIRRIRLHAAPVIGNGVIVIGAAHLPGDMPKSRRHEKGYVRGYDVRTGKRLWIFHTILRGQFGHETWENESAAYTGNVGVWAQMTIDEELNMVYLPWSCPPAITTAAIVRETRCSPRASSRSISRPACASGTTSWCTTESGISTFLARRSSPTSRSTAN